MLADTIWKARLRLVRAKGNAEPLNLELTQKALDDLMVTPNWWMFIHIDPATGKPRRVYDMPLTIGAENRIQNHTGAWENL